MSARGALRVVHFPIPLPSETLDSVASYLIIKWHKLKSDKLYSGYEVLPKY